MTDYYVKKQPSTTLRGEDGGYVTELLWGDPIRLDPDGESDSTWLAAFARGRRGRVRRSHVKKASSSFGGLLEFYVIDVGQGDAVLCRTPDDHWHLIDAGVPNARQMTKKGAANFLRWKFLQDLREDEVRLHTLTASHPDYDHYGGMLDLLSGTLDDGRTFDVAVDSFFHTGMGRFAGNVPLGEQKKGAVDPFPHDGQGMARNDRFIVELLDGLDSFANPPRPLTTSFAELAGLVAANCQRAQRLSVDDGFLPGYGPDENDVNVRILGPVVEQFGNRRGLRRLGSGGEWEGKTRNGHSIVYRFDYGNARILLTGDLNEESQRLLLSYVDADEFAVDVAKGCHHGSDDVNLDFLKAMQPRATVISSGDNESYAHPRPRIMGASARYGRESKAPDDEILPPLLYSTELARSVSLAYASSVKLDPDFSGPLPERWFAASKTQIKSKETKYRPLKDVPIATDLVYGLVNVRTDGETILCAVIKESGSSFDKQMFQAGVDAQ